MKQNNKIIARGLSVILAMTLLIMTGGTSYATETKLDTKDTEFEISEEVCDSLAGDIKVDKLTDIVNETEILGFDVSNVSVNEENSAVINLEYDGVESTIEVLCATDQQLCIQATEGDLCNQVLVNDDGTMYIDGKLVQSIDGGQSSTEGIVYMNAFRDTYQVKCPYGIASNYTVYYRTLSDTDVRWTTTAYKLSLFAFSLMLSALFPTIGPTLELATILADYFKTYDPYSDCGSYISKEYFHTKGYFVNTTLAVRKCVITVFSDSNFRGVKKAVTSYFCHSYTY